MKTQAMLLAATLTCAFGASAQAADTQSAASSSSGAAPAVHHPMVKAAAVPWGAAPPFFKTGMQFASLAGDPSKDGELFVVRLKMPDGYSIARHTHPADEHVTVLQGELHLDMGTGSAAHKGQFATGDYVMLPAKMEHAAKAKGETIVQVHGRGPFAINYVDSKDDPRNSGGSSDGN